MQVLAPQFEVKKFNENIYFDALFFLNDLKLDISVISIFSFIQLETTNEEFIKNLANIELLDCDERKVSVFNLQEFLEDYRHERLFYPHYQRFYIILKKKVLWKENLVLKVTLKRKINFLLSLSFYDYLNS